MLYHIRVVCTYTSTEAYTYACMGVSKNQGTQYRPQNGSSDFTDTHKKEPQIYRNSHGLLLFVCVSGHVQDFQHRGHGLSASEGLQLVEGQGQQHSVRHVPEPEVSHQQVESKPGVVLATCCGFLQSLPQATCSRNAKAPFSKPSWSRSALHHRTAGVRHNLQKLKKGRRYLRQGGTQPAPCQAWPLPRSAKAALPERSSLQHAGARQRRVPKLSARPSLARMILQGCLQALSSRLAATSLRQLVAIRGTWLGTKFP